jgi:hypothetical protein
LAQRLGASPGDQASQAVFGQAGWLRDSPAGKQRKFRAREAIRLATTGFEWRATTGWFGCMSVVDSLHAGSAELDVRLFGVLPVARATGPAAVKGQLLRYLAELAWAPDAILRNSTLVWAVLAPSKFRVGVREGDISAQLELTLGADGRIASVYAPDRPRHENGVFVERPWHGRFFEYQRHASRWIPSGGEVGWTLDNSFVTWHGELTSWTLE